MALQLVDRVWMLAERLYIHAHSTDEFLDLLKSSGINYDGATYADSNTIKGEYTFMSEPNFAFAEFMKQVPTHKYLSLLEHVIFDEVAQSTADDNWNYYGERIKHWYPELLELLTLAGVSIDTDAKQLNLQEIEDAEVIADYLPIVFADSFIDHIREEANAAYSAQHFLSVSFLARKIIEVTVVRLCEIVFPKVSDGTYNESNHDLWYDKAKGQYRGLGQLLDNVSANAAAFHEDKDLVLTFIGLAKPLRKATNECVHRDYARPDASYLRTYRIPYVIELGHRLFRKYCNP